MPVMQCPHCRKPIAAFAEVIGRKASCPHCRRWIAFAGKTAVQPPAPPLEEPTPAESPEPAPEPVRPEPQAERQEQMEPYQEDDQLSRRTIWILSGVAGMLAVVLIALIVIWITSGSSTPVVADDSGPGTSIEPKAIEAPAPKKIDAPTPVVPPKPPVKITPPKLDPPPPPPKKIEPPAPPPQTPVRPANLDEQIAALVKSLNETRKSARLGAVTLDAELSRGCEAHANYVIANLRHPKLADSAGFRDEDPSLPNFDEAGKKAAKSSVIVLSAPSVAIDVWISRLNSRLPLLNPDLRTVGVGAAQTADGQWACVVDVLRGLAGPDGPVVAYPAPNQTGVPLSFSGGPEVDDPAPGYPVSLQFPLAASLTDVVALLTDERGNRVPTATSTPEKPLPGVRRPGLIGMIPKQQLSPKSTYRARVSAQLDGKPFTKEWSFTTEDEGDADGAIAARMLQRINAIRKQAELPAVTLDDELTRACKLHAKYLVTNALRPETQGLGVHEEVNTLPGYTPEGDRAAKASDIAIGDFDPIDSLDGWMATLYHRVPILEPSLRKIGFGCARTTRLGWVTVLNVHAGRDKSPRTRPIFYPVDNQTDVPLNFPPGGEMPNPIPDDKTGRAGFPITVTFPFDAQLNGSRGTLEDDAGKPVPVWFSSKESPANPKFADNQGTTVCLIPKAPLRPGAKYRVNVEGLQKANPWKKSWSFTTAKTEATNAAVAQTIERLNRGRQLAGVAAVTLDADASRGCQAHADYLRLNSGKTSSKGFKTFDEDPNLPGFSEAGQTAARRSSTSTGGTRPDMQIDDMLGTLARRGQLLEPSLRRVGFGCSLDVGSGWVNVLDLSLRSVGGEPVVFPNPGQEKVPIQGRDRVPGEKESGFPITIQFPGPATIRDVRASLAEPAGTTIDIWLSSPTAPFDRGTEQPNVIAIHPLRPLRANSVYSFAITAEVNGAPWRLNGRFSTGD